MTSLSTTANIIRKTHLTIFKCMFATIFLSKTNNKNQQKCLRPLKISTISNEDVEVSQPKGNASTMNNDKTYT